MSRRRGADPVAKLKGWERDGLRVLVGPPAAAREVREALGCGDSAPPDALVAKLAGVMAVNSLSCEAVLARFLSADLLAAHAERLGKSGKGGAATLAARVVAAWQRGVFPPEEEEEAGAEGKDKPAGGGDEDGLPPKKRLKADGV